MTRIQGTVEGSAWRTQRLRARYCSKDGWWNALRRQRHCRDRQFKTSHLHSDEFKPSSSDSGFYVREAETGRQTKQNGFIIPVLGKLSREDWHSLPQPLKW